MKKIKILLLAGCLTLTAILGGCASAPKSEPEPIGEAVTAEPKPTEESAAAEPEEDLRTKAMNAYRELLLSAPALEGEHEELMDASFGYEENREAFGEHYELFAIEDLDDNALPELIALSTVNFRWTTVSVFTFADGKAVLLKQSPDMGAFNSLEQNSGANGAYILYICKDGHIHNVWRGTDPLGNAAEENSAYVIEGTSLKTVTCTFSESENAVIFSDIAKPNTAANAETIA